MSLTPTGQIQNHSVPLPLSHAARNHLPVGTDQGQILQVSGIRQGSGAREIFYDNRWKTKNTVLLTMDHIHGITIVFALIC